MSKKTYRVEYAYKRGSPGANAVGTKLRKTTPFEDKDEADKHAQWLVHMGCKKVNVVEE